MRSLSSVNANYISAPQWVSASLPRVAVSDLHTRQTGSETPLEVGSTTPGKIHCYARTDACSCSQSP